MFNIVTSGFRGSNADEVMQVKNECDNNVKALYKDFVRGARAWDVYKAVDGSQYEESKRRVFKEEDRKPWQFDFASAKVDTLAGTIIAELPDPEWVPVVGDPNILTEAIRESYLSDKELFNYSMVLLETIRDGCIHSGWCKLGVSKKYHPAGNISLERLRPGYFVPSAYWQTNDDNDLDEAYQVGYYSAERMKLVWGKKHDEIARAIAEKKYGCRTAPPDNLRELQKHHDSQVGEEWRVIEKHYLEVKNTIRLIGLKRDSDRLIRDLDWVPFPVTEDRAVLERFGEINNIDWETVQELPFEKRIHKVKTVTDLSDDLILEKGDGKVQCNSLPYLHYTTSRVDGHDIGIAEKIADLQEMLNERMSHTHQLIAKASGGSTVWNEDLFPNPKDKQRVIKNANKPGHNEFASLDDVKNAKIDIDAIQVNPAIFQQVSVIYNELLPIISRVSDAMSSITNSETTGVLFEKQYQVNKIANVLFDKFAKQLINNLGEKYFYQWQHTYGTADREVKRSGGGKIVLNRKVPGGVLNDVKRTPRCRVIVNENFSSATYQMRQRMQVQDIIKSIPQEDYLRMNAALGIYFDSVPMDDESKEKMRMVTEQNDMMAQMRFMNDMTTMQANMGNNAVMMEQSKQMLARMKQPAMAAGAPQPGAPSPDMVTAQRPQIPESVPEAEVVENSPPPEEGVYV